MLWPGPGGCSGVSDPACPDTTMVSRRWVTSTIAQPRICRPRSNTGELQLLWPAPLPLNCQLSTRRIQTGAQHIFTMATTFHSLCPSLQKDLDVSGPLCPAGTQRFRICPKLASRMKIALILLLSMSWSKYKNIFVFAKGLFPYYIISYNKQGSFQMITKYYNNGPRVVRKYYVLWRIQNMQQSASMPSSSSQSQFSIIVALKLKLKN